MLSVNKKMIGLAVVGACAIAPALVLELPTAATARVSRSPSAKSITISTWGGPWTAAFTKYFARPFTQATGTKVQYVVNGTDPDIPVALQEQGNDVTIDLVDSASASELTLKNDLQAFPQSVESLLKRTSAPGTVGSNYITYGLGPNIIVCNTHIVKRCPTTPSEFFNVHQYPGSRMMLEQPDDMSVIAMEAAGISRARIASDPPLAVAGRMLSKIKPYVKVWASSGSQQIQVMASGEVGMGIMWDDEAHIEIVAGHPYWNVSWDGSEVEGQYGFLVPKHAPNAAGAFQFLNWFAKHPKNQAAFAVDLGVGVPSTAALKFVPANQRKWQPTAHPKQLFLYPGTPWYKEHARVQAMWESAVE